jgi:hypothetical protein
LSEPVQPESEQPESAQSESEQPESAQSESDHAESAQPESARPEPAQPESAQPRTMQHVPSKRVPTKPVPAKHVLVKHEAATRVPAISVLEKLVHAKCTHPNQKQVVKKCASMFTISGLTAEQLIMVDPVPLDVVHHCCVCLSICSILNTYKGTAALACGKSRTVILMSLKNFFTDKE